MERCENLRVRFVKELDDYKAFDDDVAQKARFIETGFETMEEFSDSVQKLLSMYDLERFIAEQERLIKRVPELEEEVRRLKPREDQLLEQIKENDKMSSDLQSKLQMATNDLRSASSGLESQKGRLSLLQDEVDRFTAKIAAQTKAEAKVREALGASQKETAKIEEILQEKIGRAYV
jgi:chromosome segregation ATPase